MKLFNWLVKKEGKIQPAALGVGAAVVVAAVGGYLALSPSSDMNPNTVFSSNDDPTLVYVDSNAGGVYNGNIYNNDSSDEKEGGSSIRVSSKSLNLMNEYGDKPLVPELDEQENHMSDQVEVYAMDGAKTGLGIGDGAVDLGGEKASGMAGFQKQLDNMKAMLDQQQAAAAKAAEQAAATGDSTKEGAGAGQGVGKLDKNGGMANANGSYQTDSFGAGSGTVNPQSNKSPKGAKIPSIRKTVNPKAQYEGGREAILEAMHEYDTTGESEAAQISKMAAQNTGGNAVRDYLLAVNKYGGTRVLTGSSSNLGTTKSTTDLLDDAFSDEGYVGKLGHDYENDQEQLRESIKDWIGEINELFNEYKGGFWGKNSQAGVGWGAAAAVGVAVIAANIWNPVGWVAAVIAGAALAIGAVVGLVAHAVSKDKMKKERDKKVNEITAEIKKFKEKWEPVTGDHAVEYTDNAMKIIDELKKDEYWDTSDWDKKGNTDKMKDKYEEMRKKLWPDAEDAWKI